jgi:hypothetical protein
LLDKEIASEGRLKACLPEARLQSLRLSSSRPGCAIPGVFSLELLPSVLVAGGLFVNGNDHYALDGYTTDKGSASAMDVISAEWKNSLAIFEIAVRSLVGAE